jgi:hypothetical protein
MKKIGAFALFVAAVLSGLPGLRPRITSPPVAYARVGEPFSYRITASRLPREFSATVPPASRLSTAKGSGWVVGTPTEAGTFVLEVRARNVLGEGVKKVSLVVTPPLDLDVGWTALREASPSRLGELDPARGAPPEAR